MRSASTVFDTNVGVVDLSKSDRLGNKSDVHSWFWRTAQATRAFRTKRAHKGTAAQDNFLEVEPRYS
eukprot:3226892-Amphidinium_carterae.1